MAADVTVDLAREIREADRALARARQGLSAAQQRLPKDNSEWIRVPLDISHRCVSEALLHVRALEAFLNARTNP